MFKVGIALTSFWVLFSLMVLGSRHAEWLPLFGQDERHLALNAIGDTLAGLFAPLAFLWLFIATWLQRQELALQRKELSETRVVLDAQMAEMRRSADESNEQTRIMNKTLRSSMIRDEYTEFSTRLFYLASQLKINRMELIIPLRSSEGTKSHGLVDGPIASSLDFDSTSSIDAVYTNLKGNLQRIFGDNKPRNIGDHDYSKQRTVILATLDKLHRLINASEFKDNPVISARIEGLALHNLHFVLLKLIDVIDGNVTERKVS